MCGCTLVHAASSAAIWSADSAYYAAFRGATRFLWSYRPHFGWATGGLHRWSPLQARKAVLLKRNFDRGNKKRS